MNIVRCRMFPFPRKLIEEVRGVATGIPKSSTDQISYLIYSIPNFQSVSVETIQAPTADLYAFLRYR